MQRKTLLNDAMQRGEPFAKISPRLREIFEDSFRQQQKTLEVGLKKVFDSVSADFDKQFVVEEVPNEERDAMKQKVLEFVTSAREQLDGPIEAEFAKAIQGGA